MLVLKENTLGASIKNVIEVKRFSSLLKLLAVFSLINRFITNLPEKLLINEI